jgi:hypothetical protein
MRWSQAWMLYGLARLLETLNVGTLNARITITFSVQRSAFILHRFYFMLIWIDLANSPHVPFFRALAGVRARGHGL